MSIQPFPLIEAAFTEVVETLYAPAQGNTGGDLSYNGTDALYVMIGLVPGAGSTDQTSGSWAIDVDVFAPSYAAAMSASLALESALLTGRFVAANTGMILDNVYQNSAPAERPWADDNSFRVGATYVVTARRSG